MKKRRVVVTGLGVVSANGIGINDFWSAIKNGKSGVSEISSFDVSKFPVKNAAGVKNFNPLDHLTEKIVKQTARFGQFALVSAKEAIVNAGLESGSYDSDRTGVIIGTAVTGLDFAFEQQNIFLQKGPLYIDTFMTSIMAPNAATRAISLEFKAKGPCYTLSSSCVASANAIGWGTELIKNGKADIMIVGGAESLIHPTILMAFYLGRIITTADNINIKVPRPFDLKRSGTVLGEGSAILILEEFNHALARGVKIYAEIAGYSVTSDSYHIVIPDPEGTQGIRMMKLALKDSGVGLDEVNYINAHGTATIKNDIVETKIIKEVFGKRAYNIPISATKSMTGHHLGGSGAIEALISVLAIENSFIPPTINYEYPDPKCDLDYVPLKGRQKDIKVVISNSFGFGGFNSSLIFRKY